MTPKRFPEHVLLAVHIAALSCIAIAQPLLDVLSRNATFFVASAYTRSEIISFVALLCGGIPLALTIIRVLVHTLSARGAYGLHLLQIGFLGGLAMMPPLKHFDFLPDPFIYFASLTSGMVVGILYHYSTTAKSFISFLGIGIVIIPAYFLFFGPASQLTFQTGSEPRVRNLHIESAFPIVMVIFDELSLVSIMDENEQIDSIRCPNLHALAGEAYWFRNTTTVAEKSELAIPAILTGKRGAPGSTLLPTVADHPDNLFTFLGNDYRMKVFESQTFLCPPSLTQSAGTQGRRSKGLTTLLPDAAVVYMYIILPHTATSDLPSIHQRWGSFTELGSMEKAPSASDGGDTVDAPMSHEVIQARVNDRMRRYSYDRRREWREFVESIDSRDSRTVYFSHMVLPHFEWEFLPSGRSYLIKSRTAPIPGLKAEVWQDDLWHVLEGNKRFLLQVGAVDWMVGQLIDHLKQQGMYDQSLIIITSDHGVSFRPRQSRRLISIDNAGDILAVPLIMKIPGQKAGVVSDRNVEVIDILPSITDLLGIEPSWTHDGQSVFDTSALERSEKLVSQSNDIREYTVYASEFPEVAEALHRQVSYFQSGSSFDGAFRIPGYESLIGAVPNTFQLRTHATESAWIENLPYYSAIELDDDLILADISGTVHRSGWTGPSLIAVSVNGVIRSVTKTLPDAPTQFSTVISDAYFRGGMNQLDIYFVEGSGDNLILIEPGQQSTYRISHGPKGTEALTLPDGTTLQIERSNEHGYIDTVGIERSTFYISGWSADTRRKQLPKMLLVFMNNSFYHAGDVGSVKRQTLAKIHNSPALINAGFLFRFIDPARKVVQPSDLRVIALFGRGGAVELPHYRPSGGSRQSTQLNISSNSTRDTIFSSTGKKYIIEDNYRQGSVDRIAILDNRLTIFGWAADVFSGDLPEMIAVFEGGQFLGTGLPGSLARPELAKEYDIPELINAGYRVSLDTPVPVDSASHLLRVYALYRNEKAALLRIHSGARH